MKNRIKLLNMSTSLFTRETLIKTLRYQSTSTREKGEVSIDEAGEKLEQSPIADGNIKSCSVRTSLMT